MKKNNKKADDVKSTSIIKSSLKESWLLHKKLWIFGIIVVAIIAIVGAGAGAMKSPYVQREFYYVMFPKELPQDVSNGKQIIIKTARNPEFDGKLNEVLGAEDFNNMFRYYFVDENGEKVFFDENGTYKYVDDEGNETLLAPTLSILLATYAKYQSFQKTAKIVAWVVAAVAVVGAILAWYLWDLKQYKKQQVKKNNRPRKTKKSKR